MEGARANMLQGAMMGLMVGGLFGFAVGCYSAIQTRRFMAIPISTIVSGVSFGFILEQFLFNQRPPSFESRLHPKRIRLIKSFNDR